MADQLSIVNRALLSIGGRGQVSTITPSDGSREADVAAVLFTPTFEALARTAHWNCLRRQIGLTLSLAASGTPENPSGNPPYPPSPWAYSYLLPPDCLRMRFLLPPPTSSPNGTIPLTGVANSVLPFPCFGDENYIRFEVALAFDQNNNPYQVVLTNQSQAQAVYTANLPNPAIWDSQFQAAMVSSLAAYFVPALSLNMALMQASIRSAETIIAQARASDGNEGTAIQDHVPDFIRARSGYRAGYGDGWWQANGDWAGMAWP